MKVYGPYTRKDGRQHVILIDDNNNRKTISYPRYIMQEYIGAELEENETVDHIDGDFTNNDISNLQILSREDNARKSVVYAETINLICKVCGKSFPRRKAQEEYNRNIRKCDGPFCSNICVGKFHH